MIKYNHYTVKTFAALHHVTTGRVRSWILTGRLPAEKWGRDWMIPEGTPRPEDKRLVDKPIRNRRKK